MMLVSPAQAVGRKAAVSVVVVVYNIPREAPRTLFSLSASYQRHIHSALDTRTISPAENNQRLLSPRPLWSQRK
jgi:hypothetical protein